MISCSCFCIYSSAQENVANGKTTLQSSTFLNYNSSLAVDGDMTPTASKCATTTILPHNGLKWWQVDLGISVYVTMVSVTLSSYWKDGECALKSCINIHSIIVYTIEITHLMLCLDL